MPQRGAVEKIDLHALWKNNKIQQSNRIGEFAKKTQLPHPSCHSAVPQLVAQTDWRSRCGVMDFGLAGEDPSLAVDTRDGHQASGRKAPGCRL